MSGQDETKIIGLDSRLRAKRRAFDTMIDDHIDTSLFKGEWEESVYRDHDKVAPGEVDFDRAGPVYLNILSVPEALFDAVGESHYEELMATFFARCKTMLREKLGEDVAISVTTNVGTNAIWAVLSPEAHERLKACIAQQKAAPINTTPPRD